MARAFICGCSSTVLTADEEAFIRDSDPWGLILFKRNVLDREQMRALTDRFREITGRAELAFDGAALVERGRRVDEHEPEEHVHDREEPDAAVLETIFAEVGEALGLELFFHFQTCDQPRTLRLTASGGLSAAQREYFATIHFSQYLCGQVADQRARLVAENLAECESPEASELRAAGVQCYAGFPLIAHGQLLGTVAFATQRRSHLQEGELQLIQTVSDLVANRLARARSESLLRESEERLRLAAQTARFGIHDYDVQNDGSVWSAEMYAILGLPLETSFKLGQIISIVHPDDRARLTEAMQAALDPLGTGECEEEFRICRADTEIDNGKPRRVSCRLHRATNTIDITPKLIGEPRYIIMEIRQQNIITKIVNIRAGIAGKPVTGNFQFGFHGRFFQ